MCKWFALVLSIEMCGCLFSSQFVFPHVNFINLVIYHSQYSELEKHLCIPLVCVRPMCSLGECLWLRVSINRSMGECTSVHACAM